MILLDGVGGGDVERQRRAADPGGGLGQRLRPADSTSIATTRGAVAGEHLRRSSRRYRARRRSRCATLPSSGRSQSAGGVSRRHRRRTPGRRRRPTWPTAGTAAWIRGRWRQVWRRGTGRPATTVAPRCSSLPSDRVKPSSARCAIRSSMLSASARAWCRRRRPGRSGPMLRSSGVKNSCSALSPSGS